MISKYQSVLKGISYFKKINGEKLYHNDKGPAVILIRGNKKILKYCKNNLFCNFNGKPGCITYNLDTGRIEQEMYYNDEGCLHREDGPALIDMYPNGNIKEEIYYKNNLMHNENGPSLKRYTSDGKPSVIEYRINGKYYRENGPAYIKYHNGLFIKFEQYYKDSMIDYSISYNYDGTIKGKIYYHRHGKSPVEMVGIELLDGKLLCNNIRFDISLFDDKKIKRSINRLKNEKSLLAYKYIAKHCFQENIISENKYDYINEVINSKLMIYEYF